MFACVTCSSLCICNSYKVPYSSFPLISLQASTAAQELYISTIMQRNNARNCESSIVKLIYSSGVHVLDELSHRMNTTQILTGVIITLLLLLLLIIGIYSLVLTPVITICFSTTTTHSSLSTDSMVYRKNFEYVERRVGTVPSDNSIVPYFNASVVIRIPIQPMR